MSDLPTAIITREELAALAGVDAETVRKWERRHKLLAAARVEGVTRPPMYDKRKATRFLERTGRLIEEVQG